MERRVCETAREGRCRQTDGGGSRSSVRSISYPFFCLYAHDLDRYLLVNASTACSNTADRVH